MAGEKTLLSRDERRAAILEGASQAFARAGFAATSMADIARACGVTAAIIYRHFDSKEALYRQVLASTAARLQPCMTGSAQPFGVDLKAFLEVARASPEAFELFWRHAAREPKFSKQARELREAAVSSVREALDPFVPEELQEWVGHAIVGFAVEGVLNWIRHGDESRDEQILRVTRRALTAGVQAWVQEAREP